MDGSVIDDFIARYEQGDPTQGYSEEEARSAFERAVRTAPPETLQRAARTAVDRLDDGQRAEFDELLRRESSSPRRSGQRDAGSAPGLDGLFGGLLGSGGFGGIFGDAVDPDRRGTDRSRGSGGGPNIGGLLRSPVGRAVIGGIGAFALKEITRRR